MSESNKVFRCAYDRRDEFRISQGSRDIVRFFWKKDSTPICLATNRIKGLIAHLQHCIDTGNLLPEDPPEVTDEAKEQVKALLAAVGVECDPEQLRIIQGE